MRSSDQSPQEWGAMCCLESAVRVFCAWYLD
jgi:hypothetical protein